MRLLTPISALVLALLQPLTPSVAPAQQLALSEEGFRAFLPQLRAQAAAAGVSRATLDRVFPAMVFSPRTVELDRAQPGGTTGYSAIPAFAPYRGRACHCRPDQPRPRALRAEYLPTERDRPPLWRPAVGAGRDLGQGDQLRRDHRQFRPAEFARQPRL